MKGAIAAVAVAAALAVPSAGARSTGGFGFVRIASGLPGALYVTTAPGDDSTLYVVEQTGRIEMVRDGQPAGTFLDMRSEVSSDGERGLLSMAFSPAYASNHLYYVDYTDLHGDSHVTQVNASTGATHDLLFVKQPYPNHNGGQLEFDRKGLLYVGFGDGGTPPSQGVTRGDPQNHAQTPSSRLGKLLRIDPTRPGAAWQTVGEGLRNPWRFSFDRATGDLWIGDVGAGRYEEVDVRPAAKIGALANYGWSRFEGPALYNPQVRLAKGRLVAPFLSYSHDSGGCAVTGGYVYRGTAVPAARGRYVYGDFCSGVVWSVKPPAPGKAPFPVPTSTSLPNLSSFGEDGRGELYATTLDGDLYALRGT